MLAVFSGFGLQWQLESQQRVFVTHFYLAIRPRLTILLWFVALGASLYGIVHFGVTYWRVREVLQFGPYNLINHADHRWVGAFLLASILLGVLPALMAGCLALWLKNDRFWCTVLLSALLAGLVAGVQAWWLDDQNVGLSVLLGILSMACVCWALHHQLRPEAQAWVAGWRVLCFILLLLYGPLLYFYLSEALPVWGQNLNSWINGYGA